MRISSGHCRLVALFALAPLWAAAAAPKAMDNALRFAAVRRQVDESVAAHALPSIAIAAVERGRIVWMHTKGWADIAHNRAATPDTVYRIGSVSKSLTATAIAIAKNDGSFDVMQPLSRYLPAYAPQSRLGTARLQDLLDMNAGLMQAVHYRGLADDFPDLDGDRFVALYAVAPLASRSRDAYSNMGPELAARAVAAAMQKPFAQIERERLFAPLRMTRTQCVASRSAPAALAAGYRRDLTPIAGPYETDPTAGAGCVSSLRDLASYASFHLSSMPKGRAPLGAVALARLHTPRDANTYVNGWGSIGSGELAQLASDGQVNGGGAVILLAPAHRAGVVVLANAADPVAHKLAQSALEVLVPGSTAEFERAAAKLQADREREAAGASPPPGPWRARGEIVVDGNRRTFAASVTGGAIDVQYDASPVQHGTAIEPDDGFARWEIPCADLLPACRRGSNAAARLQLARDGDGYAGAISVESTLGLFPYEVHLVPEA
jgi:CubicO group peptidase (beta-lactamase class C family)